MAKTHVCILGKLIEDKSLMPIVTEYQPASFSRKICRIFDAKTSGVTVSDV